MFENDQLVFRSDRGTVNWNEVTTLLEFNAGDLMGLDPALRRILTALRLEIKSTKSIPTKFSPLLACF
jgi:hypothetical protein